MGREYSGSVLNIESRFNAYREQGYKTMFVFLDIWGNATSCEGVKPGKYDWAAYDEFRAAQPLNNATLLLAFDLKESFESQFPAHLDQLERWDALAQTPHVNIEDRTGKNPAKARREFERLALAPKLSVVSAGRTEAPAPVAGRDRSHLSLVPG